MDYILVRGVYVLCIYVCLCVIAIIEKEIHGLTVEKNGRVWKMDKEGENNIII